MASELGISRDHLWKLIETTRALLDYLVVSTADRQRMCEYLVAPDPTVFCRDRGEGQPAPEWLTADEWPDFPDLSSEAADLERKKKLFAANLRRHLAEAGLSQLDLAEKLGISDSAISQYLSGKHKPQSRTLHKLAGVLGCETGDLWPE